MGRDDASRISFWLYPHSTLILSPKYAVLYLKIANRSAFCDGECSTDPSNVSMQYILDDGCVKTCSINHAVDMPW